MKKLLFTALALMFTLSLASCGGKQQVELHIFAAASMTETMDEIIENYKSEARRETPRGSRPLTSWRSC